VLGNSSRVGSGTQTQRRREQRTDMQIGREYGLEGKERNKQSQHRRSHHPGNMVVTYGRQTGSRTPS